MVNRKRKPVPALVPAQEPTLMRTSVPKPQKTRYPVWNTKAIMVVGIPILVLITFLVYTLSNRSFIVETERALLAVSACLFVFFAVGLYSGAQIQHPGKELDLEQDGFEALATAPRPGWSDILTFMFAFGPPDFSKIELPKIDIAGLPDGGDDLVGCLVSIVLWVVAAIVITILVWILTQVLAIVVPLVGLALYWVFYRALKLVFSRSSECCKQWLPTLKYSLLYTMLFTGWLFVVVWFGRYILG